jgi:hypothetical protein
MNPLVLPNNDIHGSYLDDHNRSKRSFGPVATAERRIRFREVRLIPRDVPPQQTLPTSRGKERAHDADEADSQTTPPTSEVQYLKQIVGLTGPPPRSIKSSKGSGKKAKQKGSIVENVQMASFESRNN